MEFINRKYIRSLINNPELKLQKELILFAPLDLTNQSVNKFICC
ncbi:MAG TPA: hypothetical protein PLZ15_08600 [Melioribacteraceae bacterium]|nr:hypothetical protein [Melioribacteraceae bacterium]